jgi:ribosome-associated toxin RatA of RatAB toxin-antitoxin module
MKIEKIETAVRIELPDGIPPESYLDEAYSCLKDMESYPSYMADVLCVKSKPLTANTTHVEWEAMVEDAKFNWKQINTNDHENRTIHFEMTEGDFELLDGQWQVAANENLYSLRLNLRYAIGLPIIEEVLGPVLKRKMQTNSISMLSSIKKRIGENNGSA